MKIQLWTIGKPHDSQTKDAIEDFTRRINHYFPTEWKIIAPNKQHLPPAEAKKSEATRVLELLQKDDYLIVLDERGKQISSEGLAELIQARANASVKNLIFFIGGAYGTDMSLLNRAQFKWSLSQLVFPHQIVRLILAEQVYRACTILRNEKYHHV
ncbi:MAG TPA: 23S rRNA (pseudouridine(1915)-N(3))-methyltransferase RlmH [Parasegetibacter sp.]